MSAQVTRPPFRPDIVYAAVAAGEPDTVVESRGVASRLWSDARVRRVVIVVGLAAIWQLYGAWLQNPLMFPSFSDVVEALWEGILNGVIPERIVATLRVLIVGYVCGVALAAVLTGLAVATRFGADLLSTLTAMFNPLPAIAILPLALLWFGLGMPSLVFVIVHSVLWATSLNTLAGFQSVPDAQRMAGQNAGLRGPRYVALILVPAAFPSILTGLKIGWAFAWRTLIAAELVFGVSSRSGGLGWYIFENRSLLETANVFAGLLTVIVIGLLVEYGIFRTIENHTVLAWGMQR